MDLTIVGKRLAPEAHGGGLGYAHVADGAEWLLSDLRQVWHNARLFNEPSSALGRAAAMLDARTEQCVEAWLGSLGARARCC